MAYPTSLSSLPTTRATGSGSPASDYNAAAVEINALELELGINPSGAAADLVARLAAIDASIAALSGGGGSGAAVIITGGTLSGASSSQDLTGKPRVIYTATVAANHALTFTGTPTPCHITLALAMSATGYTFSVNGSNIELDQAASATSVVDVLYDGTNYYVVDLDPSLYAGWRPADNGLKACTVADPQASSGTQILSSGVGFYMRMPWPKTATIATLHYGVGTASGAGNSNTFFGLYSAAGTLIAKTVDQSTAIRSTGVKNAGLTAEAGQSLTNVPGGFGKGLFLGFVQGTQDGTTAGALRSGGSSSANLGLAAAALRAFSRGSGLSALPATVDFTTSTTATQMIVGGVS